MSTRFDAKAGSDRRFVLWLAAGLLAAIVTVSWISPDAAQNDPTPTTYNTGSAGIKAAFLLLPQLGYGAERWDEAPGGLKAVDAARTTLVFAEPLVPDTQVEAVKAEVAEFLARGGRVLATGTGGAYLLPGGGTKAQAELYRALCYTTPEGQGELARVGTVAIADAAAWGDASAGSKVEQRCGQDAVVVRMHVGKGEAIWWSSAMPLTNRGLKDDTSLKLVLASLGEPGRRVLFDETFHGAEGSVWDTTGGLPMWALEIQAGVIAVLLVLSFGRRNGPVRTPVHAVRSSPLEFAESMGHLYQKAGATAVATEGARRRLLRFLQERCGIPAYVLSGATEGVVAAVEGRFGGDWHGIGAHLTQAGEAEHASLAPKSALRLVKALDEDLARLAERIKVGSAGSGSEVRTGEKGSE